jgi:omega-6 fatty acid desaturase (delta-12 desaturase)
MTDTATGHAAHGPQGPARDWVKLLAAYRTPHHGRSVWEILVSVGPLLGLWAVAVWALAISPWLTLALSIANGAFLVRVFMVQHDCGHGAFFRSRRANDRVGRCLGVLTFTPYDVWRRKHAIHHGTAGNLDARGTGDIPTLTVAEYRAMPVMGRALYRLYRHPLFLFGVAPAYVFLIQNRLPFGLLRAGRRYWISALGTDAVIAALLGAVLYLGGPAPLLLAVLPTLLTGATIGMWLFYIQHQFEETRWDHPPDWQLHEAALHGSSHYDLPPVLRWFTANIGIHHVHHLYAGIPFYRLPEVLRDHPELAETQRMTLRDSLKCARLHLWDETGKRLLSFAAARQLPAQA